MHARKRAKIEVDMVSIYMERLGEDRAREEGLLGVEQGDKP